MPNDELASELIAAVATLTTRLQRMEDLEEIKQLKARYCAICDDDHNPDMITSIFTEDGVWEGPGIGAAEGHVEIKALFERFQATMSYSQHMTMNPIIEVQGERATGTWTFFGPFTFYEGNRARWQATRYAEEYKKVNGRWLIAHLRIAGRSMSASYEKGWAKQTAEPLTGR